MKILIILLILLITNIWTFLNAQKIKTKIELFISKIIFKNIINKAKNNKKIENVDNLTFDDVFKEE